MSGSPFAPLHVFESRWQYAWRRKPQSPRQREAPRLSELIKQCRLESGGGYAYSKIAHDLRDMGECCGKHRVYHLIRRDGLRAQLGYRRRAGRYVKPSIVAPKQSKLTDSANTRLALVHADVGRNVRYIVGGHARHGRHVTELPVMGARAIFCSELKCHITVM